MTATGGWGGQLSVSLPGRAPAKGATAALPLLADRPSLSGSGPQLQLAA